MLLGRTGLLHASATGELIEGKENTVQQITVSVGHAFFHGNRDLARVILPAAQNFYLLLF